LEYDPRYIAFMVLSENSQTKMTLDKILDKFALEFDKLSKQDRSLANAIIFGTLRWQLNIDWIIKDFSTKKTDQIDLEALLLIRIALFQIVFMERIPTSAAVNTAVNIAKKVSHKGVAGFVNAVLRKASTNYLKIKFPSFEKEPELFLSVKNSMPVWIVKQWIKRFGIKKTSLLCESINKIPDITIRTNTLKTDTDKLIDLISDDVEKISKTSYSDCGISFIKPKKPIHKIKTFKEGFFQVQDQAAQLITNILDPKPDDKILDACAGLGVKTAHIAQLMENKGSIVAADTDLNKLDSLEQEMERLGIYIVSTKQVDLLKVNPENFKGHFDKILIDAPCSGLGVLRRNPDAKWKRTKKDVARLANKQQKMLLNAADLVKPGGTIVYAVCSCEKRENQDVINFFLDNRKDFSINTDWFENNTHFLTFNNKVKDNLIIKNSLILEQGFLRTYPDMLEMDGFFAASIKRNEI